MVTSRDAVVLSRIMATEGWDTKKVVEASIEAFLILRDWTGQHPEFPIPKWVPPKPSLYPAKLYWEKEMGWAEKTVFFFGAQVEKGTLFWEKLSFLSEGSLPNLEHIPYSGRNTSSAKWTREEVLLGGAAMLARGISRTISGERLVVSFWQEGFGGELILNTGLFPDTIRVGSLLST